MAVPTPGSELRDFLAARLKSPGRMTVDRSCITRPRRGIRSSCGTPKASHTAIYVAPCGGALSLSDVVRGRRVHLFCTRHTARRLGYLAHSPVAEQGLERITFHDSRVSHPVLLDEHTLVYLASDPQGSGPWLYALNVEQRVPHRISFGLERYTSLAASDGGTRLVATVDESEFQHLDHAAQPRSRVERR